MVKFMLNGAEVEADENSTLLEAIKFYGIKIPTLCYHEGLSPYGSCRLCVVEVSWEKDGRSRLVTSCTYPVREGIWVRTHSTRVMKARKMLIELLIARCSTSKILQDLAAEYGVSKIRFKLKHDDCILCGLCVRMCEEQMQGHAIGFVGRGKNRRISTPFDMKSEECRLCGGCIYICPACQLRCQGPEPPTDICGACMTLSPTCLDVYDDAKCYMVDVGCGTCVRPESIKKEKKKE